MVNQRYYRKTMESMEKHNHNRYVCECMPVSVRIRRKILEYLIIFVIGGGVYCLIELAYRAHTHWTMFILGGLCLILVGLLNEGLFPRKFGLIQQSIVGALVIIVLEFITGLIINVWLGWDVWDYSNVPGNIMGQVCLPFFFAWIGLSAVAIVVDDYLRYWWFGGPKPEYTLWTLNE